MQDTTKIPQKLTALEIEKELASLDDQWEVSSSQKELIKTFQFKGFYKTMGFVNAVAWIAQAKMHHPDMQVSFDKCVVLYTTHDANGLTQNDFVCARAIDQLLSSF